MDSGSATQKDYYYVLGISPDATTEEVTEAYQELNDRFGPHVNIAGQDPEAMMRAYRDISEAFEVLSDPERRRQYDQANMPNLQKAHLRKLWGRLSGADMNKDQSSGVPVETRLEVEITLREAVKGTTAKVRLDDQLPCSACVGLKPVQRSKCTCRGTGFIHNSRMEAIAVPPGQFDSAELKFSGKGKFDMRMQRQGNLVLVMKLRPHSFFSVMGRDLTCTVPITILEAVLGGEVDLPTATGKVVMKIQPLTQSGRVYRLRGMGLAGADLLVTMEVVTPTQISGDEVELFRKLKAGSTIKNPREEIFAKLSAQATE